MNDTVGVELGEALNWPALDALSKEVHILVGTLESENNGVGGEGGEVGV